MDGAIGKAKGKRRTTYSVPGGQLVGHRYSIYSLETIDSNLKTNAVRANLHVQISVYHQARLPLHCFRFNKYNKN